MLMGNLLIPDDPPSGMATRERESVGPRFGIAHATVVPENAGAAEPPGDDGDGGGDGDDKA